MYSPVATDVRSTDVTSTEELASSPQPGPIKRYARKIYNPLGFKKAYNFVFFFILAGALVGFSLYNIRSVDVDGHWMKAAAPGEPYHFRKPRYNTGMKIHLGSILPAGVLVALQFFPIIRYKAIIVHRINGWLVTLLLFIGNAGALMIADGSFGGFFETHVLVGLLALVSTVSAVLGVVNIKLKQIDQHRKWMIRCWVYCGSIITLRFIQIIAVMITSQIGGFYVQMNCDEIDYMGGNATYYASCAVDGKTARTAVMVDFNTQVGVEEVAAAFRMTFGPAGLLALALHAVLVEVYFHLTPAESERLRKVAYERQLEKGHKHPGSTGLTSDRLGDAAWWTPKGEK